MQRGEEHEICRSESRRRYSSSSNTFYHENLEPQTFENVGVDLLPKEGTKEVAALFVGNQESTKIGTGNPGQIDCDSNR